MLCSKYGVRWHQQRGEEEVVVGKWTRTAHPAALQGHSEAPWRSEKAQQSRPLLPSGQLQCFLQASGLCVAVRVADPLTVTFPIASASRILPPPEMCVRTSRW